MAETHDRGQGMFEGAIGQYIDSHGKTRMLVYPTTTGGISLMTSPIPPLALKRVTTEAIKPASIEAVLAFTERKGLQIVSQDGNKSVGIQGVWVEPRQENPGIYYGYIPLKKTKFIKDIPQSQRGDPLRTDALDKSELLRYRKNKKIAEILQYYTLFTYATYPDRFPMAVDEVKWKSNFTINPKHNYDIDALEKKYILDTPVIYSKGKIIVPDERTRDNLVSYLMAMVANDRDGVLAMKDLTSIDGYYKSLSDFRASSDQLIFTSRNGLMRWRNSRVLEEGRTRTEVLENEDPDTLEPYYYRNPKIRREHLMIVQNVIDGDRDRAISVGYRWLRDNTNALADAEILENVNDISYVVYTKEESFTEERVKRKTDHFVSLIKYGDEEGSKGNGKYGALLFFP